MSLAASIDVKLVKNKDSKFSIIEIIENLIDNGWNMNDNGVITFLPLNDDDSYNWQRESISKEGAMSLLRKKELNNEVVGIALTWKNTNTGGTFLFWNYSSFSLNISINRKVLKIDEANTTITDVNWYLSRLLPILNRGNFRVESFSYEENYFG